jgi:hypothetical protein
VVCSGGGFAARDGRKRSEHMPDRYKRAADRVDRGAPCKRDPAIGGSPARNSRRRGDSGDSGDSGEISLDFKQIPDSLAKKRRNALVGKSTRATWSHNSEEGLLRD